MDALWQSKYQWDAVFAAEYGSERLWNALIAAVRITELESGAIVVSIFGAIEQRRAFESALRES